jgi:hypothetical protein
VDGFMPHGHCYLWRPDILWLNVISDAFIFLAYICISTVLFTLLRRRPFFTYRWAGVMFGLFISLCGFTHLVEVITVWHPIYLFAGVLKACTAAASIATAVLMVPIIPRALSFFRDGEFHSTEGPARVE